MNKKSESLVLWFEEVDLKDVPLVGGKNAALGEMYQNLTKRGIRVPNGFALTATAYRYFLEEAGLKKEIPRVLKGLNTSNLKDLQRKGAAIRSLILKADLPSKLEEEVVRAYRQMEKLYGKNTDVAVRSSATAEDLPGASFAGQQETYLNIEGEKEILIAVKKCIASLFTDRAISYREDKGFSHFDAALSVGVQKMVRSDLASSGVMFTIDTETGFDKVVVVTSIYGLGEFIVQGKVTPDEFIIFKPGLEQGKKSIIARNLGNKNIKMIYQGKDTATAPVTKKDQDQYSLSDQEVLVLADWGVKIENYFSKIHKHYQPMDIEWAKDGRTGELYIVQARPETIHSTADKNIYREYRASKRGDVLVIGTAVGSKIASGKVKVIRDPKKISQFAPGEVLVTEITDPDWEPIMKMASAIITDKGGRTSHAAIVSRELGIPCIVGSEKATTVLKNGVMVTVDCSSGGEGLVYRGQVPFEIQEYKLNKIPQTRTKIMVNIGAPDEAFKHHALPVKGVGLGRLEFIIASHIKIHPRALIDFKKLQKKAAHDKEVRKIIREIEKLTPSYDNKVQYYVDELAEGIAKIGAAFFPHEVIIRFSDFKTNEYSKLLGGNLYEPHEENPMIGWRGASRYHHSDFAEAFGLECRAMKKVREEWGLENVTPMIPFCRTPEEGEEVLKVMAKNGLDRKIDKKLKVYVMCEIPSNVILAHNFLKIFDGMSIGSNDLTQLVLGLDRDSDIVNTIANENNSSVTTLIAQVVKECRKEKKYIGICGQAPSDYPDFAALLVKLGIESISLNPDTVIKTMLRIAKEERKKH
ncbi:MAG: phosphoenolpyruvate synthase [Anaplasmataceae bacterium]|nr:phosphoenolpyruvate synthase [Anaplasmataceae bacterium]